MCQNKKPPTVYRRSRGRSCRSSGVAPCGDCGATRHSIALRFQVLCLGLLPTSAMAHRTRKICNTEDGRNKRRIVHCFVPSSKALLASSGYIYHPTFEVCHTKRHRYAIRPSQAHVCFLRSSDGFASSTRCQHINHTLHTPCYLTGLDGDPDAAHQCIYQAVNLLAPAQLVGIEI